MDSVVRSLPRGVLRHPTTISDRQQFRHKSTSFLEKDDVVETLSSPLWPVVTDPYHYRLVFDCNGCPLTAFQSMVSGLMAGFYYLTGDMPRARGWMLFTVTGYACLPLSMAINLSLPFEYIFDWDQRWILHYIQMIWANLTVKPFFTPHITGLEHIPQDNEAFVFVSNHQSWLDIYSYLTFNELHLR